MKFGELVSKYDKRLGEIMKQYREDLRAARERKGAAIRELDAWLEKAYDSPKDGEGVVVL